MPYKVVFRAESLGESHRIPWEPGCPLLLEAIQVSRNTETGSAFLQAKIRNISAEQACSFRARFTVTYRDGTSEAFETEPLDADIAAGGDHQIAPIALASGDAVRAEGLVLGVRGAQGSWTAGGGARPLPRPEPLGLSDKALKERATRLLETSSMLAADAECRLREEAGWWLCPCGQPNVGTQLCAHCGVSLQTLRDLEDEATLERLADERAEREREKEAKVAAEMKWFKRIAIVVGILVIAALVYFFAIKPAITETCYRVVAITSYDENEPGRVSAETVHTLDGSGNVTKSSFEYHSKYGSSHSDPTVYLRKIDTRTGVPVAEGTELPDSTGTVEAVDEFDQPTRFTVIEFDEEIHYEIEYHSKGHIRKITRTNGSDVTTWIYDENGYQTYYSRSSEDEDEKTHTTSSYEFAENGRAVTRLDTTYGVQDEYSYTYDENGNIASIVYGDDPSSKFVFVTYEYGIVENPSPWTRAVSNLKPSVSPL